MFLWLVCIFLVLWIMFFRFRRRRMRQLASLIPAPDGELPLIGIAHTLVGNTEDIMNAMKKYSYSAMQHNGIIRFWLGHILYIIVQDPVDMEVVLRTCLEKDDLHRFMRKVIGYGGIFAPVAIWRKRRKILVPAFSPKILENFVKAFSKQSEKLASKLAECADSGQFSVWRFLNTYTLDSVCETALGVNIKAQDNPSTPFLCAMEKLLNLICERIFHLWLQPDWLYKFFPQHYEHEKNSKIIHDFINEVIYKKREELKKKKNLPAKTDQFSTDEFDLGRYHNQTFLDLLITLSGGKKGYSDNELREEVIALMVAGTDTSAVAIGYTLKLLAKYPKVQQRIFEELQHTFGSSDRPLVKEDLSKLNYMERVVKESLRLFPPVPFIIRKVLKEIMLPSGKILPVGSGITLSIWGVHRDPKYWGADAECFDPDRFLPERINLQHSCSFMPFSHGPRNCLGYQYALMSIKTALVAIVRRYKIVGDEELGPVPHIKCKIDIMMKAVDDYKIGLQNRVTTC